MTGRRGLDDVVGHLRVVPSGIESRLTETAQRLGTTLRDRVAEELGGAVLRRRSGRLVDALAVSTATEGGAVATRVGIDLGEVPYAALQEFGFNGVESVRAHLRQMRQTFGRPIGTRQIEVRAYDRRVDYPAHSFLRQALADMTPDILTAARGTVDDAVGES